MGAGYPDSLRAGWNPGAAKAQRSVCKGSFRRADKRGHCGIQARKPDGETMIQKRPLACCPYSERAASAFPVALGQAAIAGTEISITPRGIALLPPIDQRTATYTTKARDRQSHGLGGRTFADIELTPLATEVRRGHLYGGSPLCYEAIAFVG